MVHLGQVPGQAGHGQVGHGVGCHGAGEHWLSKTAFGLARVAAALHHPVSRPCRKQPVRSVAMAPWGPSSHLSLFLSLFLYLLQFKMFRFPLLAEFAEIAASSELARLPEIPGSPGRCGDV